MTIAAEKEAACQLRKCTKEELLAKARGKGLPLADDFTKTELVRLLARYEVRQHAPVKAKVVRKEYSHDKWLLYEALWSDDHNGLVRYLRTEEGGVRVAELNSIRELPNLVAASKLRRPSC